MEALASELGCKVGELLTSYLGSLWGLAPCRSKVGWNGVEEWFQKRASMWKSQYISKGGRLTMIHNTLSNLLIYFMSLSILKNVRLRLEKIPKDFL